MLRTLAPIALCVHLWGCAAPPPDLDLSLTRPTDKGLVRDKHCLEN